jgi:hypothetical protein
VPTGSLHELTDVTQGKYEYRYEEDSVQQSTTTSSYQGSGSSEIPRYAPSFDPAFTDSSQAPHSSSPVTPGYITQSFADTTAALGSLTLEKGKERENGNFQVLCQDNVHLKLIVGRICGATGFNFILSCSFSHSHHASCSVRDGSLLRSSVFSKY